ncbi:MAG TPA: hypothetical protein PKY59_15395 [Pyrinomonadaceae bacterium]|nr:hypothetical protein [Pyrinomonadaceae bacterium]
MGKTIIPRSNEGKITWSLNFEEKFPSLAASLGFSFPESTALLNDSRNMRFAILNGVSATAYSKAANAFKYDLLNGVEDGEPEERRYRLRYFLGDEPVGTYSDVIVAVTMA